MDALWLSSLGMIDCDIIFRLVVAVVGKKLGRYLLREKRSELGRADFAGLGVGKCASSKSRRKDALLSLGRDECQLVN